jgi:hypothetical protein
MNFSPTTSLRGRKLEKEPGFSNFFCAKTKKGQETMNAATLKRQITQATRRAANALAGCLGRKLQTVE